MLICFKACTNSYAVNHAPKWKWTKLHQFCQSKSLHESIGHETVPNLKLQLAACILLEWILLSSHQRTSLDVAVVNGYDVIEEHFRSEVSVWHDSSTGSIVLVVFVITSFPGHQMVLYQQFIQLYWEFVPFYINTRCHMTKCRLVT